jgi:hypothetical protein
VTWFATTLWEMLAPPRRKGVLRPSPAPAPRCEAIAESVRRRASAATVLTPPPARRSMQDRYDMLVEEMKSTYGFRVRKWRKSSSGVAYVIRYHDGRSVRLLEAPYPRGPMSCAIFLHEVGHHAIGLGVFKPRCLEEYHVWVWALREMRARGFNVTPAVEKRMHDSMKYAVRKARTRGLQVLPVELQQYL